MATVTSNDFRLNFLTNRNEVMSINVPNANTLATGAQIAAVMLDIINAGVVQSVRGEPLLRQNAELVTTERRDFNVLA